MGACKCFALPLVDASLKVAKPAGAQWFCGSRRPRSGWSATILAGIRFSRSGGAVAGGPSTSRRALLVYRIDPRLPIRARCHRRDR